MMVRLECIGVPIIMNGVMGTGHRTVLKLARLHAKLFMLIKKYHEIKITCVSNGAFYPASSNVFAGDWK